MDIIVTQEDLTRLLKEYVTHLGINITDKDILVDFKAGRKHPSYAVISVMEKTDTFAGKPGKVDVVAHTHEEKEKEEEPLDDAAKKFIAAATEEPVPVKNTVLSPAPNPFRDETEESSGMFGTLTNLGESADAVEAQETPDPEANDIAPELLNETQVPDGQTLKLFG